MGKKASDNHLGPAASSQSSFEGAYAHSSLCPVATYVSRPELEQQLREKLCIRKNTDSASQSCRTLVVWGLGGSGKSQLVLHYIQQHRHRYQAVFWIEAGQKETIERDYLQIYNLLFTNAATSGSAVNVEHAISAVKNWFNGQDGRCLWVMDSADTIDDDQSDSYIDLTHYMPDSPALDAIVITRSSRAQNISSLGAVAVTDMNESEAVQLFRNCAKFPCTDEAISLEIVAIVNELGFLPLAVLLAGSYVSETPRLRSDLSLYLPEYHIHREQLLSRQPHWNLHRYRHSVLSTWEMSITAVERQSPFAARLFTFLSFISLDDIFPQLFQMLVSSSTERVQSRSRDCSPLLPLLSLNSDAVDHITIETGFAMLQAYSLISWREDQQSYAMHKLVHAWGHDRLGLAERQKWSAATLDFLSHIANDDRCKGHSIATRLMPHIMASFSTFSAAYQLSPSIAMQNTKSIDGIAMAMRRLGRFVFEHQIRVFLRQWSEQALGKEHPDTLLATTHLARVLGRGAKLYEAERLYRSTLELTREVHGSMHERTLKIEARLAETLSLQGKYQGAEEMLRRNLAVQHMMWGMEDRRTLRNLQLSARIMASQGELEEAEEILRIVVAAQEKLHGPDNHVMLKSFYTLAWILSHGENLSEAEAIYQRVLESQKVVLGPLHVDTCRTARRLTHVFRMQGKHEQAEELSKEISSVEVIIRGKNGSYIQETSYTPALR